MLQEPCSKPVKSLLLQPHMLLIGGNEHGLWIRKIFMWVAVKSYRGQSQGKEQTPSRTCLAIRGCTLEHSRCDASLMKEQGTISCYPNQSTHCQGWNTEEHILGGSAYASTPFMYVVRLAWHLRPPAFPTPFTREIIEAL